MTKPSSPTDLHKDAYGFRPRDAFMIAGSQRRDREAGHLDGLVAVVEREIERDKSRSVAAIAAWRARRVAILCDTQAYGIYPKDPQNAGYYCYLRGLPYQFEKEIGRVLKTAVKSYAF